MAQKTVNLKLVAEYTPEPDPPESNAELNLEQTSYSVNEGNALSFKILRTVRTDQVIDVDWAFVNVSITPISGTARFQLGESEVTVNVTAQEVDTTEQGTLEISNPTYVSGPVSQPVLGSNTQATITVNDTGVFVPNNPTNYASRVTGVAGWGMDSAFGTAKLSEADTTVRIRIQRVTNLSDANIEGSLRRAAEQPGTTRTVIVFDKSGWCDLGSNLTIDQGNKTFAFQTAPSPGFYTKGAKFRVADCNDVLLWHIGHSNGENASDIDAMEVVRVNNFAIVNGLVWFGADECFSGFTNTNITVFNTAIAHCMYGILTSHNYGGLWYDTQNVTWTRSVMAHQKLRGPRMNAENFDYFNNIIANLNGQDQVTVFGNSNAWQHTDNLHHNFWLAGPDSSDASEALGLVNASGDFWEGGSVYYPDGQSGRPLRNKYRGGFQKLRNDVGANVIGTINSAAVAHGSQVTDITGWTDAEMVANVLYNCGPRPADSLRYLTLLKTQIENMEDGVGDKGGWCGTTRTSVYTGDGSGFDALIENTKDNFDEMDTAGVFVGASLVSSGADYAEYDFPVDSNGFTKLDTWLNEKHQELMDPANFTSDAVVHADIGTTLGSVPAKYANYQMVRGLASHINLNTSMGFYVTQQTEIIYAHPTLNNHANFKPSWLTTANGWEDTLLTGSMELPDSLLPTGTITVPVKYYKKIHTGAFNFAGFRSTSWDEVLGHYVGCFLIEPGVGVQTISPAIYELIDNISTPYTPTDIEQLFWTNSPPTSYGTPDKLATSWAQFEQMAEASGVNGDGDRIIHLADSATPYTDDGARTINNLEGTVDSPVYLRPETPGGATLSGSTTLRLSGCKYVIVEGFLYDSIDTVGFGAAIETTSDCSWCVIRNNKETNRNDSDKNDFGFRIRGNYMRVHNNTMDSFTDGSQMMRYENGAGMWSRFDHNEILNMIDNDPVTGAGNSNEAMQLGSSSSVAAGYDVQNSMYDHNYLDNFYMNEETEIISNKGGGWIVVNNIFRNFNASVSNRLSAEWLWGCNRLENLTWKNARVKYGHLLGNANGITNGVSFLNHLDWLDSSLGNWVIWRVPAADTDRRAGRYILIVGDMVVDANDQTIFTETETGSGYELLRDTKFVGAACHTSTNVWNIGDHTPDVTVTYEGCQLYGQQSDPNNPAGNTYSDPLFSDRGDGLKTPSAGVLSYGNNQCFPARLEGGSIANLGATW